MRHSGMTTSVTVRARHGCWRRWCMSEDHIRLALLLSCSCGDCVATYSAPAAFSRGAQGLQLTTSSQSLMLWSAGIVCMRRPWSSIFQSSQQGGVCRMDPFFLCSGAQWGRLRCPALIRAVSCSPVGITMMWIKCWVLQWGTGDDTINGQLKHRQFHSKLQWKATFGKLLSYGIFFLQFTRPLENWRSYHSGLL